MCSFVIPPSVFRTAIKQRDVARRIDVDQHAANPGVHLAPSKRPGLKRIDLRQCVASGARHDELDFGQIPGTIATGKGARCGQV